MLILESNPAASWRTNDGRSGRSAKIEDVVFIRASTSFAVTGEPGLYRFGFVSLCCMRIDIERDA
ncbi:MAG: hypothetical protein OR995_05925 [Candidatus Nanopelagicales bacterium]|nr:hypothetical protein [Candidatus Nanopelagicales bacterium]